MSKPLIRKKPPTSGGFAAINTSCSRGAPQGREAVPFPFGEELVEQLEEHCKDFSSSSGVTPTRVPSQAGKAIAAAGGTVLGGLFGSGIVMAAAGKIAYGVGVPLKVAAHLVKDVTIVVGVAWGPLVLAAPWLAVGTLGHLRSLRR
jgi:hypothetical protein